MVVDWDPSEAMGDYEAGNLEIVQVCFEPPMDVQNEYLVEIEPLTHIHVHDQNFNKEVMDVLPRVVEHRNLHCSSSSSSSSGGNNETRLSLYENQFNELRDEYEAGQLEIIFPDNEPPVTVQREALM